MIELAVGKKKGGGRLRAYKPARFRKVYYAHYPNGWMSPYPVIRLGGRYLEGYGFSVGDSIEVVMEPRCITIKRIV